MHNRPVCFYDANVLYSAQLRDFLIRPALGDVVKARWSERVHEEWMRNVLAAAIEADADYRKQIGLPEKNDP